VPDLHGRKAETVLETLEPTLARRLTEPPPPHLAAVLPPQPRT
jgi:hypothetical protein